MHRDRFHGRATKARCTMAISIAVRYSKDLIISVGVASNNNARVDNRRTNIETSAREQACSHSLTISLSRLLLADPRPDLFAPRKCSTTLNVLYGRRIDLSGLPEKIQITRNASVDDEIFRTHNNRMMYCSLSQLKDVLPLFLPFSLSLSPSLSI